MAEPEDIVVTEPSPFAEEGRSIASDSSRPNADFVNKWQTGLLPFMTKTLAILALVFFVSSFVQLYYLYGRITEAPIMDLEPALQRLDAFQQLGGQVTGKDILDATRWQTLSTLESALIQRRYHQANVLLMSRVWITYLGFVTGMILAIVGATFVLGKLQDASSNNLTAEGAGGKVAFQTASPGLILALLGSALMFTTLVTHYQIDVTDSPAYVDEWEKIIRVVSPSETGQPGGASVPPPRVLQSDTGANVHPGK